MAAALYTGRLPQTATRQPASGISESVVARLWQRMTELYGRQWEASYGHVGGEVFQRWFDALAPLSIEQIKRGLEAVVSEAHEYPPSLIKFLRLARTAPAASHLPLLPEPPVKQTQSVGERSLAQLRRMAGLKPKPLSGWKQPRPELLEKK